MNIMYVVMRNNDGVVLAISEDKVEASMFVKQKSLQSVSTIRKVKGKVICNNLMVHFENLFLESSMEDDLILTRIEREYLDSIIETERDTIKNLQSNLEHVIGAYKLSKKQKQKLKAALSTVESFEEKSPIKLFKLSSIIKKMATDKSLLESTRLALKRTYEGLSFFK